MKSIVPNSSLFRSVTAALCFALLSGTAMSQNDLILQGIIDFSVPSGGSDGKAIHLVATSEIADLSVYGIGVANNGGGTGAYAQGDNRLDRGQYFHDRAIQISQDNGILLNWSLQVAEGIGHQPLEMAAKGAQIFYP